MTVSLASIIWQIHAPAAWAAVLGVAIACLIMVALVYARTASAVPRIWAIVMVGLRCAALLAICLSLLQPIAVHTLAPSELGGIAILIDGSRSMGAIDSGEQLTRFERVVPSLSRLVAQIPPSVPVYAAFFDSQLMPLKIRAHGKLSWPAHAAPTGEESDINGAVAQLLVQVGNKPLRAVVVFSDGRQVGGAPAAISSQNLPPIFPVLTAGLPRDLVLERVFAPVHAYLDEPLPISAQIRATNLAPLPVQLQVRFSPSAGAIAMETQNAFLDESGTILRSRIAFHQAGARLITLEVKPIAREASTENNRLQIPVEIETQRMRAALIGTFPNRDFQFLREQLEQSPWIDSTVVLPQESISPAQLRQQQVIILNDLAARQLDSAQWAAVKAAAQAGTGLILIAGANHLPAEYLADPNLAALLPFQAGKEQPVWRTWAGADAYFRFQPMSASNSLLQLSEELSDISRQWLGLPAMYHYLQMPPLKPDTHVLLRERESNLPVLTESRYGSGKIMLVGFNETWRWRSMGTSLQERFWRQLIRHAAPLDDAVQRRMQPAEVSDLSPEPALLSRLASNSTQKVYSLSEANSLWNIIQQYEQAHPRVTEEAVWHSPWLFALVLGCWGAEWALRKRFGLA